MTYRISGLDPADFAHLVGKTDTELAGLGAVRMIADAKPGFPCRITLEDAEPGEALLLVNHVSHGAVGPYRASHAIFVREGAGEAARYEARMPPSLDTRILSLRGFDGDGMMRDACLAHPGEADPSIRAMLANPAIDHIDAHNATRGCFAARIDRAG